MRAEQAGEEQQRQRLQLAAGPFDQDQVEGVEQAGEHREQVAAQLAADSSALPHISSPQPERGQAQRRGLKRRRPFAHQPQVPRRRRRSSRYCRTRWRCRAWSAGCRHARRRGRRRRRRRPRRPRWSTIVRGRCTGWRNIQAIAHRNGSASASRQKPAATGPDSAVAHQERPAGQRQIADQQGDKGQRLGSLLGHARP